MRRSFLSLPRLISLLVVFGLCLAPPKAHAFMCAASEPCKLNCTSPRGVAHASSAGLPSSPPHSSMKLLIILLTSSAISLSTSCLSGCHLALSCLSLRLRSSSGSAMASLTAFSIASLVRLSPKAPSVSEEGGGGGGSILESSTCDATSRHRSSCATR